MADETNNNILIPALEGQKQAPPHIIAAPSVQDSASGGVWVLDGSGGYKEVVAPFAVANYQREQREAQEEKSRHITDARLFGDVESWAAYILRYGSPATAFLTWNNNGLNAILDYHEDGKPGRLDWKAVHQFQTTKVLQEWVRFTQSGAGWGQKETVEFLEQMADTIIQPTAAELANILRVLRSTINTKADVTLREDGGSKVEFSKDATIKGAGELPPFFLISVPLLQGHTFTLTVTASDGTTQSAVRVATYDLKVRLRLTPTETGVIVRTSILNLEASLEDAYADRVTAAQDALGAAYPILRAANS